MSRFSFIETVAPIAVKVRVDGGVLFPSVSIAQMLLETGGKIHPWNNLVGYKVGSGKRTPYWNGRAVKKGTWEVYSGNVVQTAADFRAYDSIEHCLKDQALLFLNNARYKPVVNARTREEQAYQLRACGYATDPQYDGKIVALIRSLGLENYDKEAFGLLERIAQLEERVKALEGRMGTVEAFTLEGPAPSWAEATVKKLNNMKDASGQKILSDTDVSRDLARMLVVLDRIGIFDREGK